MRNLLSFIFTAFTATAALAQVGGNVQNTYPLGFNAEVNYVQNPSCATNVRFITQSSGGILTRGTTVPIEPPANCVLDATALNQTATWSVRTFDPAIRGQNCEASFIYNGTASGYRAVVAQNAVRLAHTEQALLDTTGDLTQTYRATFPCGDASSATTLIVESTLANSASIKIGRVYVGAATQIGQFSGLSDWIDFPSVAAGTLITATTTNPTYGTVQTNRAQYRRIGGGIEVRWDFRQSTGGTAGSGLYLFNIPSSICVIDTNRAKANSGTALNNEDSMSIGFGAWENGTNSFKGNWSVYSSSQLKLTGVYIGSGSVRALWNNSNGAFSDATLEVSLWASLPCQGLSASQSAAAANQTDFGPREVGPMTITAVSVNPTKGTTVTDSVIAERKGKFLIATYRLDMSGAGTAGTGDYLFQVPLGLSIDTTNNPLYTGVIGARDMPKSRMDATGRMWQSTPATANFVGAIPYTATTFRMVIQSEYSASVFQGSGSFSLAAAMGFSFTVKIPIAGWEENQRAPTLVGSVTSNSVGAERIERAFVNNTNGSASVIRQSGSWLSFSSCAGTGNCTYTISPAFSDIPTCVCSSNAANSFICAANAITTSSVSIFTSSNTVGVGANENNVKVICMGPR